MMGFRQFFLLTGATAVSITDKSSGMDASEMSDSSKALVVSSQDPATHLHEDETKPLASMAALSTKSTALALASDSTNLPKPAESFDDPQPAPVTRYQNVVDDDEQLFDVIADDVDAMLGKLYTKFVWINSIDTSASDAAISAPAQKILAVNTKNSLEKMLTSFTWGKNLPPLVVGDDGTENSDEAMTTLIDAGSNDATRGNWILWLKANLPHFIKNNHCRWLWILDTQEVAIGGKTSDYMGRWACMPKDQLYQEALEYWKRWVLCKVPPAEDPIMCNPPPPLTIG